MPKRFFLVLAFAVPMLAFAMPTEAYGANDAPSSMQQNQIPVSGIIVDQAGAPVLGASVMVPGTQLGTVTDLDGKFIFTVPSGTQSVEVSCISYKTILVTLTGAPLRIMLEEDTEALEEVVVIGYGTVKKRDLTGSVSSVKADEITSVPVTSTLSALQGRAPGVLISQSSWAPGDDPNITVRGDRSINASNDPLFVVDGVPISGGINEINPGDIQSMEILKDASATAIYGARGANGVILITTKHGKEGRTVVEYNGYVGVQTIQNRIHMMDGAEYAEYVREAYRNVNTANKYTSDTPNWILDQTNPQFKIDSYVLESLSMAYDENGNYDPSKVRSFDWFDYMTDDAALITDHQLNIRGGTAKTNFMVSGTYTYNDGVAKDKSYNRYSTRTNISHQINSWAKIGAQQQFSKAVKQRGSGWEGDAYLYRVSPLGKYIEEDGTNPMLVGGDSQGYNPLLDIVDGAVSRPLTTTSFIGSYFLDLTLPIDGLSFRSNLGLEFKNVQDYEFFAGRTTSQKDGDNYAKNANTSTNMYTWENYFTYDKSLGSNHHINMTLLQSIQSYKSEYAKMSAEKFPSDALLYYDMAAGLNNASISSSYTKWSMSSFMGRVNYSIKNRYLFTVSARYDGSSRLAEGHKWVLFPSGAFAWKLSEEPWMDVKWINDLKLRASYGKTGNSAIDPYQTLGSLQKMRYVYGNGATEVIGYAPDGMANTDLTWETTDQYNLGLDFSLFERGRLSGSLDVYYQKTHDLLLERSLPIVSGFSDVLSNIGATSNRGIELSLNSVNIERKNFSWTTNLTFSYNDERIEELFNGKEDSVADNWFIGSPINVYYDYEFDGIWQNNPEDIAEMEKYNANGMDYYVGSIRIKDQDNNYKINADDRTIIGNTKPKAMVGLVNNLYFHGFDFSLFLYSNLGYTLKHSVEYYQKPGRSNTIKMDYYTDANPSNRWPRPIAETENLPYSSVLQYSKADFLRVRNVTLGYTLPERITGKANISKARFYVSANNPFIWTNFTGIDPEGAQGRTSPSYSSWMFGVNLTM